MMYNPIEIFKNDILWKTVLTGFIAQVIKMALLYIRTKKWNWRWLAETGGMPSSHTAGVCALSTMVGFRAGFSSILFAATAYFSFIVMYDSAGLRRAAGKQASVLNKMMDELKMHKKISEERLKEFLGHSPNEVFAGALLGIIVGWLLS